jgi:hypothetical protein
MARRLLFFLVVFLGATFLSIRVFNDDGKGWRHIITSDGRGYYAYLPALVLYNDPAYDAVIASEARMLGYNDYQDYQPGYRVKFGDRYLNKYFAGEAVLLFPFFLAGTFFAWISGSPMDGYSFFFQFFTGLGALFYLICGFFFLARILERFGIRREIVWVTMMLLLFGTNLFYYGLWQPTMSHIYSFFAINGFCLSMFNTSRNYSLKNVSLTGFFLGITLLLRPTNAVVLMIVPALVQNHGGIRAFFSVLLVNRKKTMVLFAISLLFMFIQVLLWVWQTGSFALWPYRNEGFRFNSPEIFNVLFSYRKGLFVYTPMLLLAIPGLVWLAVKRFSYFLPVIIFLVLSTYIIASWWCWYYGDGFGLRAFIDYYGIFALLIAYGLNVIPKRMAAIVVLIIVLPLVMLNLVQTWQYNHKVIQPNSMNREKFWHVFLRTDSAVINSLGGNCEMADYYINQTRPVKSYYTNLEKRKPEWNYNNIIRLGLARSGTMAGYLDSLHPYGPCLLAATGDFLPQASAIYIEGEIMIRDSMPGACNSALIVLSIDSIQGNDLWWQGFKLNDVPEPFISRWSPRRFSLMTPVITNRRSTMKVYIWQTGKKPLLVDDFLVRIYGKRHQ